LPAGHQLIAGFYYDENGNRSKLTYYHDGSTSGLTTKKLSQNCHPDPERAVGESNGEGSGLSKRKILRCAQNDTLCFEIVFNTTYTYNLDNLLTGFTTAGGPTFTFATTDLSDIDGLGRFKNATGTMAQSSGSSTYNLSYTYDMLSRLTSAQLKEGPTTHYS
jgi:hypothetical protein